MRDILRLSLISLALALAVASCAGASTPQAIPTVVLGSSSGNTAGGVIASAVILPASDAELSFPLTGIIKSVTVEVGDLVAAGQTLATLDTTLLEAQRRVADADLQAQQIAYTYLARTGTDQEHLDQAVADVARAQALLDAAQATLAQATLTAPFDGTIVSIDTAAAETAVPGQTVLTLGDLSRFRVETTDLSERDAPRVQAGQHAEVEVVALNQVIGGTVVDVARQASTIGGDAVFTVKIDLDEQPAGLMWGMTATVRIATDD